MESVKFTSNSLYIVSGSLDKTVQVWDATTGLHCQTFSRHLDTVHDIDISADGNLVASASGDTTIQI